MAMSLALVGFAKSRVPAEKAGAKEDIERALLLADSFGGRRADEALRARVLDLHARVRSLPDPDAWLDGAAGAFAIEAGHPIEELGAWPAFRESIALELETHGREALTPEIDLTRSVGWFTSLFPLTLRRPQGSGPHRPLHLR